MEFEALIFIMSPITDHVPLVHSCNTIQQCYIYLLKLNSDNLPKVELYTFY